MYPAVPFAGTMAAEAGLAAVSGPGGETGALLRAKDWSATPLGPREDWPQSLRTILDLILASPLPMLVLWGPDLAQIYNDGYAAILVAGHPSALGQPFRACWPEAWPSIAPICAAVLRGEARCIEGQKRAILRRGTPEEAWFDLTYSPLRDETGSVAGILVTAVEATARVRATAEAALCETEAEFCAAFDQSPVPMHETDCITGRLVRVNAAFCRLVGRSAEDLLGRSVSEATHPEDREANFAAFRRIARGELATYEAEKRYLRPDGSIRWARFSSALVRDSSGRPLRTVAVAQDITERKEAEAALRESEARLRLAQEAGGAGLWDWDLRSGRIFWSAQRNRIWGREPDTADPSFATFLAAVHPEDRARVEAEVLATLRDPSARTYQDEFRVPQPDGSVRWILGKGEVLRDPITGEALRLIGVCLDVTERRVAEEGLRESEARFRAMADNAPVMIWVTDPTGTCTFLSRSWYEFTGQTPETGLGFGWLDAVHPEDRKEADRTFLAANARREAFRLEYRLRRSDGEYRWAIDAAAPRFGEGGEFLGYIGSVIDITERKAAEERQALLAREVNHRAKNALAVVQAALRLTRAPDLPSYIQSVEGRVGALARAHTLLAQDHWAGANLRSLLEGELAPFRGAGQRVTLEGPRVKVPAGSAQPLAMAAHELATNAVKHGALSVSGGSVSVSWRLSGGPGGVLWLRWAEAGGPPVHQPARRGFGSRVLDATVRGQLGGAVSLAWEAKGLVCELEVPLSRAPASAP